MIPFSVLDLSPIIEGGSPADALRNTLDLARHAERLGYHRYWLAEHHNMPGIASAATAIVIAHVAGGTRRIRVGAGGVILPNRLFSAELAAALGLPFGFASHFAPDYLMQALEAYRTRFRPSASLAKPYAMVGVSVVAAETDREAQRLATSWQQQWVNLRRGTPGALKPPVDTMEGRWSELERAGVEHAMAYAAIGSVDTVHRRLAAFIETTAADELMLTAQIYDHTARVQTFEIVAGIRESIGAATK